MRSLKKLRHSGRGVITRSLLCIAVLLLASGAVGQSQFKFTVK